MSFWNRFPYTDYNDINLDWIIKTIKKLEQEVANIDTSVDTSLADRVTTAEGEIDTLQIEVETPSTGLLDRMTSAEADIVQLRDDITDIEEIYWIDLDNIDADMVSDIWDAYHAGKLIACNNLGSVYVMAYVLDNIGIDLVNVSIAGQIYVEFLRISNSSPFYTIESHWMATDLGVTPYVTLGDTDVVTSGGVYDALQLKQDVLTFDNTPTPGSTNPVDSDGIAAALALKQDVLTFDSAPTDGSTNPVESDGIYDALQLKQDVLTFDNTPTQNSTNPVTSGGVYQAILDASFAGVTFDNTPTDGSSNPVTSNGIYDALSDLVKIDSFQVASAASYTIAANSSFEFSQDVTKSGYTAIGIVGKTITGTDSDKIVFNRSYIGTDIAYLRMTNPTASAVTITNIRLWILYIKTMA